MSLPAILGGHPVCSQLPDYHRWPVPDEKIRAALSDVLQSGVWGTLGPRSREFAARYAAFCQAKYALPVLNGTVSLELILRALGIGRGDEVIVPPYTFTASVSAIVTAGAYPVFADIDPDTYTLDARAAEERITPRTKAILGVHLGGRPYDADALDALCQRKGLYLIEDAAHAHGSSFNHRRAGSLGHVSSFSFQASKNLSCGEGGAITTSDDMLYQKLWSMHHNGRPFGEYQYDHAILGTDGRMAEWQAAVLLCGMDRLEADNQKRMAAAAYLDENLQRMKGFRPLKRDERITENSYHLYVFKYLEEEAKGLPRKLFIRALAKENVCMPASGYKDPIYHMEYIRGQSFHKMTGREFQLDLSTLPHNEQAAHKEGCWLYHASLLGEKADMDRILEAMDRIIRHADQMKKTWDEGRLGK
ncbi:MAG: DegT/DnrJ/EryC1/StrS family aminotransferase [Clostridia bacterium]|nr:DegT/DnrJ/EryC1/StrS family aminotransferase [Clostridia bacterium]